MGSLRKEWYGVCFFRKKNEENECVREKLVFMCEKVLFMERMCAIKSMEGSCV
jgi:hypothetical protein